MVNPIGKLKTAFQKRPKIFTVSFLLLVIGTGTAIYFITQDSTDSNTKQSPTTGSKIIEDQKGVKKEKARLPSKPLFSDKSSTQQAVDGDPYTPKEPPPNAGDSQ